MNPPEEEKGEIDGFKFALTLIIALGTFLYSAYNYIQNTAIELNNYYLIGSLFSLSLILLFFLLFYVFIKGYSLELKNDGDKFQKERNNKIASVIYLISFLMFIMLVTLIIIIILLKVSKIELTFTIGLVALIVSICTGLIIGLPAINIQHKILNKISNICGTNSNQNKIISKIVLAVMVFSFGFFCLTVLSGTIVNSPLKGHISIDMEKIYHKSDETIPVSIQVTGRDSTLIISLLEINNRNKYDNYYGVHKIDFFFLKPARSDLLYLEEFRAISSDKSFLIGRSLENGKYNVFIKTSGLNEGYYELWVEEEQYDKEDKKGFYLSNN